MDELYFFWELFSRIGQILRIVVSAYIVDVFLRSFLERHRAAALAYLCGKLFVCLCPWELFGTMSNLIAVSAMFAVMFLTDHERLRRNFFLSVMIYLLPWIAHTAVIIPWDFLYDRIMFSDFMMNNPWVQLAAYAALDLMLTAMLFALMLLLTRVISRAYIYKKEELSAKELLLVLLPVLPAVAGFLLIVYFEETFLAKSGSYVWNVYAQYEWLLLAYQAVCFGAVCGTVMLHQRIKRVQREEKENAVLAGQLEDIERHIEKLEQVYAETRSFRHDVKNHLAVLDGLCRSGEAADYAKKLTEILDSFSFGAPSGNPVTDIIIEEKRQSAADRGIAFECGFFFPDGSDVNAFDISVILNNALSNALENADGDEPYISVRSKRRKNAYLIEVSNSFYGAVIPGSGGLPETTKPDRLNHGFGLANIRRVARKYGGELSFETENGEAVLTVLLMPNWSNASEGEKAAVSQQ